MHSIGQPRGADADERAEQSDKVLVRRFGWGTLVYCVRDAVSVSVPLYYTEMNN